MRGGRPHQTVSVCSSSVYCGVYLVGLYGFHVQSGKPLYYLRRKRVGVLARHCCIEDSVCESSPTRQVMVKRNCSRSPVPGQQRPCILETPHNQSVCRKRASSPLVVTESTQKVVQSMEINLCICIVISVRGGLTASHQRQWLVAQRYL